jgi:hypothetical protein
MSKADSEDPIDQILVPKTANIGRHQHRTIGESAKYSPFPASKFTWCPTSPVLIYHRSIVVFSNLPGSLLNDSVLNVLHRKISTDTLDELVFDFILDVDQVVRGGRIRSILLEDFCSVVHLGHIPIIVLAPNLRSKVEDVDPVMTERDRA